MRDYTINFISFQPGTWRIENQRTFGCVLPANKLLPPPPLQQAERNMNNGAHISYFCDAHPFQFRWCGKNNDHGIAS